MSEIGGLGQHTYPACTVNDKIINLMIVVAYRKEEEKKKKSSCAVCTHPSGSTRLAAAKQFVCFCIVRVFEKEDSLKKLNSVLICPIIK